MYKTRETLPATTGNRGESLTLRILLRHRVFRTRLAKQPPPPPPTQTARMHQRPSKIARSRLPFSKLH